MRRWRRIRRCGGGVGGGDDGRFEGGKGGGDGVSMLEAQEGALGNGQNERSSWEVAATTL